MRSAQSSSLAAIPDTDSEAQVLPLKHSPRHGGNSRKQAVSIRMNHSDVRNIKRLAERLGARDSDVIRFAIKLMLGKLALLQDPAVRGRNLVPVFIEAGPELMRHFELDSAKLCSIINDGVDPDRIVDPDDIQLIAMNGLQRAYVKYRMAGLRRANGSEAPIEGIGAHGSAALRNGRAPSSVDDEDDFFERSLRQYLYEKYLYSVQAGSNGQSNNTGGES